jgi:hypothetical protein
MFFPNESFLVFTNIFISSNSVMDAIYVPGNKRQTEKHNVPEKTSQTSHLKSHCLFSGGPGERSAPEKMSLLLDLDCTLVNSLDLRELQKLPRKFQEKLKYIDMKGYYRIFQRPYLQTFLDYAFANFDVSVFTAADKDYALFIIEKIILIKPNRHLKNVFYSYASELSEAYFDSPKDLRLLWDVLKVEGLSPCSTVLLDDLSDVFEANPRNVIRAKKFELLKRGVPDWKQLQDNFLLEVIPKLETRKQKFKKCSCRCLLEEGTCDEGQSPAPSTPRSFRWY